MTFYSFVDEDRLHTINYSQLKLLSTMSSITVIEILPVLYAFDKDFVAFKSKFDSVVEELDINSSDYEFRRSARERYENRSRYWGFLRLDLLKVWADPKFAERFCYAGKIYRYRYIQKTHKKCRNGQCYPYHGATIPDLFIRKHITLRYNEQFPKSEITAELLSPEECAKFYRETPVMQKRILQLSDDYSDTYNPEKGFTVRIRVVEQEFRYDRSARHSYYSPFNFKEWDPLTKKSTVRGQCADTSTSYSGEYGRGGWRFGGLSAGDIRSFAKMNGYKGEGKQYGHYAEWILHELI